MKTILLLDDRDKERNEASHSLGLMNEYKTVAFKSIEEAVRAYEKQPCQLIIASTSFGVQQTLGAIDKFSSFIPRPMILLLVHNGEWELAAKLLRAGADDYMMMPMPLDILRKRVGNYMRIIDAKDDREVVKEPFNIFDKNIMSRYVCFRINSEESLSEFWDYFLPHPKQNEHTSDCIRIVYRVGLLLYTLRYDASIVVEENESNYYFTIDRVARLNKTIVTNIIEKNYPTAIYEISGDKLCFILPKNPAAILLERPQPIVAETSDEPFVPSEGVPLFVFDFLDKEDQHEVDECISEMGIISSSLTDGKIDHNDLAVLNSSLLKFARVLSSYPESFKISSSLQSLCFELKDDEQVESADASLLVGLLLRMISLLTQWHRSMFKEGAPSADYLTAQITICSDELIGALNASTEALQHTIEDIFDI